MGSVQREGSVGGSAAINVRVAGGVLLVAHLAFVTWFALRPLDVPWVMPANLHPLASIRSDLALGWQEAARRIGGGLGLLAPLGVLLPLVGGRLAVSPFASLLRTTAAGTLISLGIELLQTGVPGQRVDVDSLLLNTVGRGSRARRCWCLRPRSWLRRRNGTARRHSVRQEDPTQGLTPTIPRVGIAP